VRKTVPLTIVAASARESAHRQSSPGWAVHPGRCSRSRGVPLAAQAAASYGDVFGGPPRFAPPPAFAAGAGAAPADYAEVFGGVAASCSIPYLDLPPAVADGAGAGAYGEIFGRFDFEDFAAPYEEMLPGAECLAEEIVSPSGSSRYQFCPHFRISLSPHPPRATVARRSLFGGLVLQFWGSRFARAF